MATYVKEQDGTFTDLSKGGADRIIAPVENTTTASRNYVAGTYAKVVGYLRKVTSAITSGSTFTDSNSTQTTVGEELTSLQTRVTNLNTDLSVKYNFDDDWIYCKVNGVWQRWRKAYLQSTLIYDDGVMYYNLVQYKSNISGAATTFGEHSISIAITSNYGSSGYYHVGAITSEQIDLTDYNSISIKYSNLIQSGGRRYLLIAVVNSSNTITELASVQADSSAQSGTLTADISNTQGSYRIYVCIGRLDGDSHALPMSVDITNISIA